jgi:hypothetical protein
MSEPNFLPAGPGEIPSMRPRPSGAPVLLAGAASTALALGIVYIAGQHLDFDPMLWTLDYIIPAGAFLVGLVASCGFGFATWKTGVKIDGKLLAITLLILASGYIGAKVLEYQRAFPTGLAEDGAPMSFFHWFDINARHMAFQKDNGQPGEPLGLLGYGVDGLSFIGFVLGGLAIPLGLRAMPFCEPCNQYMKTKKLASMRAGLMARMVRDKTPEREEERARLAAASREGVQAIFAAAEKDAASVRDALAAHTSKDGAKSPFRVDIKIIHCRTCYRGTLVAEQVVQRGRNVTRTTLSRRELAPALVEGLVQPAPSLA